MKDTEKLIKIAKELSDEKEKFTIDMVYGYIKKRNIKFKKEMSRRRIGYTLSKSNQFSFIENKNVKYYSKK